jgi:hypothetical protein
MSTDDLRTARERAAHATEFVFPVYRTVDGEQKVQWLVQVSTLGKLPDGRWVAKWGPFYCMADSPDKWVAFSPSYGPDCLDRSMEEHTQWEAFLKVATFISLDKAIDAAVTKQRKEQEHLDQGEK